MVFAELLNAMGLFLKKSLIVYCIDFLILFNTHLKKLLILS